MAAKLLLWDADKLSCHAQPVLLEHGTLIKEAKATRLTIYCKALSLQAEFPSGFHCPVSVGLKGKLNNAGFM